MEMVSLPEGEDLEQIAAAICAEAGIAGATNGVVEMARLCLASELLRGRYEQSIVHREVPFVTAHDGRVLIGRIDLLIRSNEDVIVVDYKTDSVEAGREAGAAESHRGQTDATDTQSPRQLRRRAARGCSSRAPEWLLTYPEHRRGRLVTRDRLATRRASVHPHAA